MCASACGLQNAHPICFGFLLNYNYIQDARKRQQASMDDENRETKEKTNDNVDEEQAEEVIHCNCLLVRKILLAKVDTVNAQLIGKLTKKATSLNRILKTHFI